MGAITMYDKIVTELKCDAISVRHCPMQNMSCQLIVHPFQYIILCLSSCGWYFIFIIRSPITVAIPIAIMFAVSHKKYTPF